MKSVKQNITIRPHYDWLLLSVIALILVGVEVVEHAPINPAYLEADFVAEVFLMGIVLPVGGGTVLRWMSHSTIQRARGKSVRKVTCVLVIENELLGGLVKHMLSTEPDLQVVGTTARDEVALLNAVRRYSPNVLVLDNSVDMLSPSGLPSFIGEFPNLRLVMVNTENEWGQVHDMRQMHISGGKELAEIARGN